TYTDISPEAWEQGLHKAGLPEHLIHHLVTMAALHRAGRYDRLADGVERVTGRPAMRVRGFVGLHAEAFGGGGLVRAGFLDFSGITVCIFGTSGKESRVF